MNLQSDIDYAKQQLSGLNVWSQIKATWGTKGGKVAMIACALAGWFIGHLV